jgi:hypothetical protein
MKKNILLLTFFLMFFNFKTIFSQNFIYDFDDEVNLKEWVIVNDDVMGGVSKSSLSINKDGNGVFSGRISTAYNGGFASLRHNCKRTYINKNKSIILKIKGDKREYQLRIKANRDDYYSYLLPFRTSGKWEEIVIPLKEMYASFRGRRLNIENFNNDYFEQITFLIGNKRNESFNLTIDNITIQ